MKKNIFLLLLSVSPLIAQTNWFVRPDGGTRFTDAKTTPAGQCSGKADASYATALAAAGGATVNLPCAFGDVRDLAFDGTYTTVPKWIIAGGDIVHIAAGQYRCGYDGPNSGDHHGLSEAGNPFSSCFPAPPSGTADHPTQFIGAGVDKTQIYGGYGAGAIFGLSGTSFITITDMEWTDHSQCTRVGAGYGPDVHGCITSYPLDDYAQNGATTNASTHDIVLRNLNIHGFTSNGILGPIGGAVTTDHVRIAFNGASGWEFDDGHGTKSSAGAVVNASYLTVEGNGCNEQYPITNAAFPAASCFDQNSGGYGDGVGTPGTPLNFTCDHCIFRYNTQDALDLLHTSGSIVRVTNSQSYGNMGQQWKLGAMAQVIFENNRTVHNPKRMAFPIGGNTGFMKYLSLFGRAGGDGIALLINDSSQYTITNNSYAGYGATSYDISCSGVCSKPVITFQNNLNIGYTAPTSLGGQRPGIFYTNFTYNPFVANDHNIFFQMRTCPATGGVCTNPMIADEPTDAQVTTDETMLDNIDFHLTSQSTNAIGQGIAAPIVGASGLATTSPDADGVIRPNPPSIGAYEFTGNIPTTGDGGTTVTNPPPDNGPPGGSTAPPPTGSDGGTTAPPPDNAGQCNQFSLAKMVCSIANGSLQCTAPCGP